MHPMVTVILPTYNRGYCLPMAVASVLSQSFKELELIIVDDNSSDNTEEICKRFIEEYGEIVKYIKNDFNLGASKSRNIGIKHSSGKYISFLDSDDLYFYDKIQLQVDYLEKNSDFGFCYGHFACANNIYDTGSYCYNTWIPPVDLYPGFLSPFKFYVVTPAVMIRADVLLRSGLFDETMRICEDLELWSRILKITKSICVPRPLVIIHIRNGEKIKYFENILARDKLYCSVLSRDAELDYSFVKSLYGDLIDLYIAVAKTNGNDDMRSINVLRQMKKLVDKPFEIMRENIIQLAKKEIV